MTVNLPSQPLFIQGLLSPVAYPHQVDYVSLVETHISWIFLTGRYAYKVKKAVDFGYVKATNISSRLEYCLEEIRLNRRLSNDMYLGVVEIIGPNSSPRILEGDFHNHKELDINSIEVAVKMRQFDDRTLLSKVLLERVRRPICMKSFASELAAFHLTVDLATPGGKYTSIQELFSPIHNNLKVLYSLDLSETQKSLLIKYHRWIDIEQQRLQPRFLDRALKGAIRECHGDLHTANIYLKHDQKLEIFDAIEFNPSLRWIDPISEIAFLVMDIEVHHRSRIAVELLNHWLEQTGDYLGMDLWRWYSAYRAVVRAKVTALRLSQLKGNSKGYSTIEMAEINQLEYDLEGYLQRAKRYQEIGNPVLLLMHGLSGSGKSFISEKLCGRLAAIRLRSDLERKRAFGCLPLQLKLGSHASPIQNNVIPNLHMLDPYSFEVNQWLFEDYLPELTKNCLLAGFTTIVDATFLRFKERDLMSKLANRLKIPMAILACECSEATAEARLRERIHQGTDPSEADLNIRNHQKDWIEPLNEIELIRTVRIKESTNIDECLTQLSVVLNQ